MTTVSWEAVARVFDRAVDLPAARRERFVRRACRGDEQLAQRVLQLLTSDSEAAERQFLERLDWPESLRATTGAEHGEALVLQPGTMIGDAEVLREIGSGGFGRVYLARDRIIGRDVALKVVPAANDDDPESRVRILREAQVVGRLRSPHIVALYRVHSPSDALRGWVFEMEYVEGRTLRDVLRQDGVCGEVRALFIARQIAAALSDSHSQGAVHGDVKPENVLIAAGDRVRLADFGLGLALDEVAASGAPVGGSPSYMAPELTMRGRPCEAADVWGFGVVLHEMLTGSPPFRGDTLPLLLRAIREHPPADLPSAISGAVHELVGRCLTKRPWRRFSDGAALFSAIAGHARGDQQPSSVGGGLPWPVVRRNVARRVSRAVREGHAAGGAALVLDGEPGSGKTHLIGLAQREAARVGIPWVEVRVTQQAGVLRSIAAAISQVRGRSVPPEVAAVTLEVRDQTAGRTVFAFDLGGRSDDSDVGLVEHFVLEAARHGAIAVVAIEPGHGGRLRDLPGVEVLKLDSLLREDLLLLLQQRTRTIDIAPAVALRVVEFARGNPRRAIDYLEHMRESGAVAIGPSGVTCGPSFAELTHPDDENDLLALRLSSLDEFDRQLLDAASIDGMRIDAEAVAVALGAPTIAVLRRLQALSRRHGLVTAQNDGYDFADASCLALIQQQIPAPLQAAYHRAFAESLADRSSPADPDRLGMHYLLCGEEEKARPLLASALIAAERRQELHRAMYLATRIGLAPENLRPDAVAAYARAAVSVGLCITDLGRPKDAATIFSAVELAARIAGDARMESTAIVYRARVLAPVLGASAVDVDAVRRAIETLPPSEELAQAHYVLGLAAKQGGDLDAAERNFERSKALANDLGRHGMLSSAMDQIGSVAGIRGDYRRAAEMRRAAAAESLLDGRRTNATVSGVNEVIALHEAGELDGLADRLEQHVRSLLLDGARDLAHRVRIVQSHLRLAEGDIVAATHAASAAKAHFIATDNVVALANCLPLLAELRGMTGSLDEAQQLLATAAPAVEAAGVEQHRVDLALAHAWLALWLGDEIGAAEHASQALERTRATRSAKPTRGLVRCLVEMTIEGLPGHVLRSSSDLDVELDAASRVLAIAVRADEVDAGGLESIVQLQASPPAERRATLRAHLELFLARSLRRHSRVAEACDAAARCQRAAELLDHARLRSLAERVLRD